MKHLFILTIALVMAYYLKAQNCDQLPFKKGATFERESYDKGDKKTSKTKSTVKDVITNGSKKEATVQVESYNKKDEKESVNDVKFTCDGDKLYIDMSSVAKNAQMGEMKDMEFKIENSVVEIPVNPTVGQTLADAVMTITMVDKKSGQEFSKTTITMSNRKVEGKETITTSAGTFECWKISFNMKTETKAMGMTMGGRTMKIVNYFSKEVGEVKSQVFSEKGDLFSYSILTKFTK
ncbi:MAG: DUF3108 domain-containing protein [Cytophagaceae bacterium]|nr:DUF3108 domain-containing protein [Cytophagaceae bacterium]